MNQPDQSGWLGAFFYDADNYGANKQRIAFGANPAFANGNWCTVLGDYSSGYAVDIDTGIPMDGSPMEVQITVTGEQTYTLSIGRIGEDSMQTFTGTMTHQQFGDIGKFRLYAMAQSTTAHFREFEVIRGDIPDLAGDLDGDGLVGSGDLDIVRANWGDSVTPGDLSRGDADGNGMIGSGDLDIVRANWGNTSAASVPEPGSIVLLLGLCIALFKRRHK